MIGGVVPVTRRPAAFEVVLAHPAPRPVRASAGGPGGSGSTSIVIVSWRATASSSTVESSTRRCLPAITPVSAITARTASKIRCGASQARSLLRHNVSTVGWNASSVNARPGRGLPRDVASQRLGRPPDPSGPPAPGGPSPWPPHRRAPTAGPARSGTDRRTSRRGTSRWRCSARKACTEPSPSRWPHNAAASSSSRSGRDEPCIPPILAHPTSGRESRTDCSAVSPAAGCRVLVAWR